MTNLEFSNEFDTLYNNISSNKAPGLDDYEKSIFLTEAQEEIVMNLYNGKNIYNESFEKTEEIRRYLSDLVDTYKTTTKLVGYSGLEKTSVFFSLPDDLWFITYESATLNDEKLGCNNGKTIQVIPVSQDDYSRISDNPFKGANDRRALRLDVDNGVVEIISKYNIQEYLIRYIAKPNPIILTDLSDGSSINGKSNKTECELNSVMHRVILKRAVALAIDNFKR